MGFINVLILSFLWRVRGGLRIKGKKLLLNKIWFALFFAYLTFFNLESFIINFIACYTSYQCYGWGLYIGALYGAKVDKDDRECELIDDILFNTKVTFGHNSAIVWNFFFGKLLPVKEKTYWLYEYSKLFGFIGTTLTGIIMTFIWGIACQSMILMLSGLGMGICYWLGGKIEKLYSLGKQGWNWGEWIFGLYEGIMITLI